MSKHYSFPITEEISWISSRNIKVKRLNCKKVTVEVAVKIASIGRYLHELHIADFHIVDIEMTIIISRCPNLKRLVLKEIEKYDGEGCQKLTDTSLIKLAEIYHSLEVLYITSNHISTDVGINKLGVGCPGIRRLYLSDLGQVTDIGMITLIENYPN